MSAGYERGGLAAAIKGECTSPISNEAFKWRNGHILECPSISKPVVVKGFAHIDLTKEIASSESGRVDEWDSKHVKLPCSSHNTINRGGESVYVWSLIESALSKPIHNAKDFIEAVLSFNEPLKGMWDFANLVDALQLQPQFTSLLSKIANLALRLPSLFTEPIPLLTRGQSASITMSRKQVACLVANQFCCTFTNRNSTSKTSEYATYNAVNFGTLMSKAPRSKVEKAKAQKLICVLNYFDRFFKDSLEGTVTFSRRCLDSPPDFASSNVKIKSIAFGVSSTCLIEDVHPDTIQVDFADKYLGGIFLFNGCVQEEILIAMRPEILPGLIFLESMEDNEAIVVKGAERFSRCRGYQHTFEWVGDFDEVNDGGSSRAEDGSSTAVITCIDALRCRRNPPMQFKISAIQRELHKAYCGFTDEMPPFRALPNLVASGNWGCGVFKGNKELKLLIQLMACAQAGKSLAYTALRDDDFCNKSIQVFDVLCSTSCTVGQLWSIITKMGPLSRGASVFSVVLKELSRL